MIKKIYTSYQLLTSVNTCCAC